ncbi:MAG TPA: TFIIB-type zinc ribbon-containing protein [Thermoplasmata archaeon]|jgi:hypothetical protein|nr:TFIIB-type zinc ribbon-containing protein [Thermoplasmata archaeon]
MATPGARTCPFCGSDNTKPYADGSGLCENCGRAFRGESAELHVVREGGEAVRRASVLREANRLGLLGLVGGFLGFAAIPVGFLLLAWLRGIPVEVAIAGVLNTPFGAFVCLGIALLVVFGWIAMWSGFLVWRGFPERTNFLIVSGIALIATSAALAGGITGIIGGMLALVAGLLTRRKMTAAETEPTPA